MILYQTSEVCTIPIKKKPKTTSGIQYKKVQQGFSIYFKTTPVHLNRFYEKSILQKNNLLKNQIINKNF